MKLYNLIKFITVACFATVWSINAALALELSDLEQPNVTEAFVDGLVIPLMKSNHSPSGVVSIVKNGKLIFEKGYGFQSLEDQIAVDPDNTIFRVASVSKLFTWVAVMQQVEQGKLDLDTDINTYLKSFQIEDSFPGRPITMRSLMTHTAGFEDGGLGHFYTKDVSSILPLAVSLAKYQPKRINAPGQQTAYSNYGAALAGLIVENTSGVEFKSYVKQNIFDPLGMTKTSFADPLPEGLSGNLAKYYANAGGQYILQPFSILSNFAPAGAMGASARDMSKFMKAILNSGAYEGGRILKEKTVRQMLSRNFSHDDRLMGMALGFYETEENGVRILGHGGRLQYVNADVALDLQNDLGIFVTFSGAGGVEVRKAFVSGFYDTFVPVEKKHHTPPSDFFERAEKYAGTYNFWRSNFSTFEKSNLLHSGLSVTPTAQKTLIVPMLGEVVEIEKNLFQQVGGEKKVAFQENAQGEITGFVMDGLPFMSTFKAPVYYTGGFNFPFLGFSILVFVGVVLRRLYQNSYFKTLIGQEKAVARASLVVAGANLLTAIIGFVVMGVVGDALAMEIPTLFKLWLLLPIISTLAGLYHFYNAIIVWKDGLLKGILARVRYSVVTFCAIFVAWFYYFWNIIGFQYLS